MIKSLDDIAPVAAYLERIGAEARSMRSAVVREESGRYWRDIAIIRFAKDGAVDAPDTYAPDETEAANIKAGFAAADFPEYEPWDADRRLPKFLRKIKEDDLFEFMDVTGDRILMVQVRDKAPDGGKRYKPWTYWSDGEWRCAEPEGALPLFGLDTIVDHETVFIHEGAKAARAARRVAEDADLRASHPFGIELTGAAHVGWIGGALNPYRTDWGALRRYGIKRAYIVADNDHPGRAASPKIAKANGLLCFSIEFTDLFPVGFDLADEFPETLFREIDGARYYDGPRLRELMHPATWMTRMVKMEKGAPKAVLTEVARNMWAYVEEADQFVCREMPEFIRTETILNKMLRPYSDIGNTCGLILQNQAGRNVRLAFRPDVPEMVITNKNFSAINVHVPAPIKSSEGDDTLWREFMEYLVPDEGDRRELERWCATLIARPDIRIGYGVIMISETQGIGKTLLGEFILAPLMGWSNVSFPGENLILSDYNDWIAHKRLVVVQEIYQGHNWRAYNALKSVITDKTVEVNKKYITHYQIDNWVHIYACSNSFKALKIEETDRRWLFPKVNEVVWPSKKFYELRNWLDTRGLGIIKRWAEEYGDYIRPGEHAPMTKNKREVIREGLSQAQQIAGQLASRLADWKKPATMNMMNVRSWIVAQNKGAVYESMNDLKKAMVKAGVISTRERIRADGNKNYFVMNKLASKAIKGRDKRVREGEMIRKLEVLPASINAEPL